MNNKKITSALLVSMLMLFLGLTAGNSYAQKSMDHSKMDHSKMDDCCMMKDGKMMMMKDGKTIPMEHDMTMKNGTKCMTNGECIMKDGKKMKMKEGECMNMDGKMDKCDMMHSDKKHDAAVGYACPMHKDIKSDKPGKCSKCGMDLEKKN